VPGLYAKPASVDELVTQTAARALDLFDLDLGPTKRWGEDLKDGRRSPVKPAGAEKRPGGKPKA
jgi:4-hydroxy-3-polyprenylbenzoate decarboxylase